MVVGIVLLSAMIVWKGEDESKASGSRAIIRAAADGVYDFFLTEGDLPTNLTQIANGTTLADLFGKPVEYKVDPLTPQKFSIHSIGITSKSNLFIFRIEGTNLVLLEIK